MALVVTATVITNIIFTLAIFATGVWGYVKRKSELSLYIGAGFGLFLVSHVLTLLGYGGVDVAILPIRGLGYLVIICGLCAQLARKR